MQRTELQCPGRSALALASLFRRLRAPACVPTSGEGSLVKRPLRLLWGRDVMYRIDHFSDGAFAYDLQSAVAHGNRFTVVIGPNGAGKSQLLRRVAERVRSKFASGSFDLLSDEQAPNRLLAISNLVTDTFTNDTRSRVRDPRYLYLGLRQASNNTSTGALKDSTVAFVLECLRSEDAYSRIQPVFRALGIRDCRIDIAEKKTRPSRFVSLAAALEERPISQVPLRHPDHFAPPEVLDAALRRLRTDLDRAGASASLLGPGASVGTFWSIVRDFGIEPREVLRLMRRTGVAELEITLVFDERETRIDNLSTGQLLLLSTFARVAANVQPNSLIMVDEPESGLHPNWQSSWIPLMRASIPSSYGCHFLLATHSPYVVSDADDVLVPAGQWGRFEEFLEPHRGRSVENILYRVFGARIVGNQMVEEDLTTLAEHLFIRATRARGWQVAGIGGRRHSRGQRDARRDHSRARALRRLPPPNWQIRSLAWGISTNSWKSKSGPVLEFKKEFVEWALANQGGRCAYCYFPLGAVAQRRSQHIDHFAPKSARTHPEWTFEPYNLVLACSACNVELKKEFDPVQFKHCLYEISNFSIVHPYLDDVEAHVRGTYSYGSWKVRVPRAISPIGIETIRIFRLDDVNYLAAANKDARRGRLTRRLGRLGEPMLNRLKRALSEVG